MSFEGIPLFNVLCMKSEIIDALDSALTEQWPPLHYNPRIKITTLHNSLREVPSSTKFQLLVSPANSYGRQDGAFDDAISRRFCLPHHPYDTLTNAAQGVLYQKWRGFAPPGTCTLVPFPPELEDNDRDCKWVAICPP